MKPLEENTGEKIDDIGPSSDFFWRCSQKHRKPKQK
jgi:hypothetical protein